MDVCWMNLVLKYLFFCKSNRKLSSDQMGKWKSYANVVVVVIGKRNFLFFFFIFIVFFCLFRVDQTKCWTNWGTKWWDSKWKITERIRTKIMHLSNRLCNIHHVEHVQCSSFGIFSHTLYLSPSKWVFLLFFFLPWTTFMLKQLQHEGSRYFLTLW